MLRFAVIAAVVAVVLSDCNPPDKDLHAFQCIASPPIAVPPTSVSIDPYPADPSKPIDLKFQYVNNYGVVDALKVDVTLEYYGSIFGDCGFHKIPLPLSNLDGCKVVNNCPLQKGTHDNDLSLDLSPFAKFLKIIPNDTYFRLNITVKDASNMTPVSCVSVELELHNSA